MGSAITFVLIWPSYIVLNVKQHSSLSSVPAMELAPSVPAPHKNGLKGSFGQLEPSGLRPTHKGVNSHSKDVTQNTTTKT